MGINESSITELVAICLLEPCGDGGLETYVRGQTYRCQRVEGNSPAYYRVFPSADAPGYYESVVPRVFFRYFRTETPGMHALLSTYQSRRMPCSPE